MARETIISKGDGVRYELAAGAALDPGEAAITDASGDAIPHGDAGNAVPLFAVEFPELGLSISNTYAAGDQSKLVAPQPGSELELFILANESIDPSTPLVSNGDGTLRTRAATGEENFDVVGYPTETATVGGTAERHTVRVI